MRENWQEGAKCLQEIANISQVLFASIQHRVAKTRNVNKMVLLNFSFFCFWPQSVIAKATVMLVTMGWSESLLLGLNSDQLDFTTGSSGSTTSTIGNIELLDILEQMFVYIEPALSLYFFFCVWGFGTVALMGNKSCNSTSSNFPPGHLKANMGKVFPLYHLLISRRVHQRVVLKVAIVFKSSTHVNLGKALQHFAAKLSCQFSFWFLTSWSFKLAFWPFQYTLWLSFKFSFSTFLTLAFEMCTPTCGLSQLSCQL